MPASKSILVVDDNGINRLLPGLILRPFGWMVHESAGGQDALKQLEHLEVSGVLLDISMPEMSGLEVLDVLRKNEKFSKLKIFAYTAFATEGDIRQLKNRGFDAILIKPLTSQQLINALNDH